MTLSLRLFIVFLSLLTCVVGAPSAQANDKYASFVMDADTGLILHQRYADKRLHPASLTKMMTMMMVFEWMDSGKMTGNTRIRMSKHAANMVPSKLNIPAGGSIRAKDALYALATKSANDVAVAIAEHIGGSESHFATMMTNRARNIGMSSTNFTNASGLHDPRQVSTARDMAKLARFILVRYPHYYHYFSTKQFTYRGVTYNNHNKLLGKYAGADGFKTGYVNASGFNLVASARRDGGRIIGVVFGGKTGASRNAHMVELLDAGFSRLESVRIAAARNMPKPKRKPAIMAEAGTQGTDGFTSLTSLSQTRDAYTGSVAPRPQRLQSMDIGAFSQLIGEGDYDPAVSKRLETGLLAVAVHKGEYVPNDVQQRPQRPASTQNASLNPPSSARWSIQIGAYSSRAHADYALRQAVSKLPPTLNGGSPEIVPLRTASGLLYRGRIAGYSKSEALSVCQLFQDCMTIAP